MMDPETVKHQGCQIIDQVDGPVSKTRSDVTFRHAKPKGVLASVDILQCLMSSIFRRPLLVSVYSMWTRVQKRVFDDLK